jgi:hypothetical protein
MEYLWNSLLTFMGEEAGSAKITVWPEAQHHGLLETAGR